MAVALSAVAVAALTSRSTSSSSFQQSNPSPKCIFSPSGFNSRCLLPTKPFSFRSSSWLSASGRRREDSPPGLTTTSKSEPAEFSLQEEIPFLLKLGSGSFIAAAAIKYGSIILPDITKPNLLLALFMITAPTAVAALLLLNATLKK